VYLFFYDEVAASYTLDVSKKLLVLLALGFSLPEPERCSPSHRLLIYPTIL
jgi:hypothetical protein